MLDKCKAQLKVLKNKEEDIKKLNDEKIIIKENEAKKYEKVILRYESYLKEKEIEVENLKTCKFFQRRFRKSFKVFKKIF